MKVLDLDQGTKEWDDIRAKRHTASEAPAMMRASKYMNRDDLLKQKATGEKPEVSGAKQAIFNRGHDTEDKARPIAEAIIGEELYPCTCEDDDGWLLASMDGITMLNEIGFEHKLINNDLRQATVDTLDDHYKYQMDQQLLVTGAEKILFMASDGTEDDCNWFWYERDEGRLLEIIEGWKLFDKDLAQYEEKAPKAELVGRAPGGLPSLHVEVTGMVTASNLREFKESALAVFESINTDLNTDEDFADAEQTVKWCQEVEDRLKATKASALAQTQSIDELFRTMDELWEESRKVRLNLNNKVTSRKKERKTEIAQAAKGRLDEHIQELNKELGGEWMPHIATDFNAAMKNKRNISSLESAANDEFTRARIEANRLAKRIGANLEIVKSVAGEHQFLLSDQRQLVQNNEPEALSAIVKQRVADFKEREKERDDKERERIRAEEQKRAEAKAEAERAASEAKAKAEAQASAEVEASAQRAAAPKSETPTDPVPISQGERNYRAREQEHKMHNLAGSGRPSADQILGVLAQHYQLNKTIVIRWVLEYDWEKVNDRMAANQ